MSRDPEVAGSNEESANLQSQSIAGPTSTADVTADKTPVTTEDQVESVDEKDNDDK